MNEPSKISFSHGRGRVVSAKEIANRQRAVVSNTPPRRPPDDAGCPAVASPAPKPLAPAGAVVDPWDPENWWP